MSHTYAEHIPTFSARMSKSRIRNFHHISYPSNLNWFWCFLFLKLKITLSVNVLNLLLCAHKLTEIVHNILVRCFLLLERQHMCKDIKINRDALDVVCTGVGKTDSVTYQESATGLPQDRDAVLDLSQT